MIKNNQLMLMMIMRMNYYIQEDKKQLETSTTKKLDKIEELSKKIDGNNLVFTTISTGKAIDFSKIKIKIFLNKIKKMK